MSEIKSAESVIENIMSKAESGVTQNEETERMQRIQIRIMACEDMDEPFRIIFYAHTVRII